MNLTPYDKREFAAATYLYWEAKAEAVEIGRIKFAKKTRMMDLRECETSFSITGRVASLRHAASNERAQNLLFTEKTKAAGPWSLSYHRGRFYATVNIAISDNYRIHYLLSNALSSCARASEDFIFAQQTSIPIYQNNTLITREDLQCFIRKANNSVYLIDRVWSAVQEVGARNFTGFHNVVRAAIPNLVASNYCLEDIKESQINFLDWSGNIVLSVPGKTLKLPAGVRDLSRIVPRRI